jgi:DNA-binding CsgD family transcriptional regulator
MERLPLGDIRQLLELVRGCYAARDFDGFVDHLLTSLPTVVPSELTVYGEIHPAARQFTMVEHPKGIWTEAILEAFRHHLHEHPFARSYRGGGDGSARQITDVVPAAQWQRTAVYNESFRPAGFDSEMVVWLPATRPQEITVAVHRRRSGFTERDRLILDLLRPHFAQARHTAMLLTQMRRAVDAVPHGLVLLDNENRPTVINQPARACLDRYFGPRRWSGRRLPEVIRRWLEHQRMVGEGPVDVPAVVDPLRVEADGRSLSIRWCPGETQALLFEEHRTRPLDGGDLMALGLTRREAEVLAWVGQGKTNEEIGRILGISVRTVAKHLERMYPRLGVENRTAAAALVYSLTK